MKIKHNFSEDSAYLEINGNEKDKIYSVEFHNLENNYIVYKTQLSENTWASSVGKTDCIRVYYNNELIFEKINNINNCMTFNDTSLNYMDSYLPKELFENIEDDIKNPLAIICPHAGYYFSGKVVAKSFSVIDKNKKYENIFIISTSHVKSYDGISMCNNQYYNTPLGAIEINSELCNDLNSNKLFNFNNENFKNDHTIDMILPFIVERIAPGYKIVPLMLGDYNLLNLKEISVVLKEYLNENNLFIISSDFSHYPQYDDALIVDNETINKIRLNDSSEFLNTINNLNYTNLSTRMCGWTSYMILLYMIENKNIDVNLEEYINSGDISGDKNSGVVGYAAINFCLNKFLNKEDEYYLIDIAKKTIKQYLQDKTIYEPEKPDSIALNSNRGAFVSIYIDDNLRGCIGMFTSNEEIYKVVRNMSISSAFNDSRFSPITIEEYNKLDIEISILSPFKKIKSIDEIKLGKHGIYIQKDGRSGTFLPQVGENTNWSLDEFLGHCSQDKAGIGWDGWKDADIYTYEAEVFKDSRDKKEAMYYNVLPDNAVECVLCPHNCKIKNGNIGICLARENINGILYTNNYKSISCIGIDHIEKKPFRNFLPGTMTYSFSMGGCNFKCKNCQNWGISQVEPKEVSNYFLSSSELVEDAIKNGCPSISYTYIEPTVFFETMIETAKIAKEHGLKNCMVSNGYINESPLKELCKYIDAFNIDLKSFSNDIYKTLNKGTLEPVLNTLKIIKKNNKWLEITFLIIPEYTDSIGMIEKMFKWLFDNGFENTPIHFIGFFPTYKMIDTSNASIESVEIVKNIAKRMGMKNID